MPLVNASVYLLAGPGLILYPKDPVRLEEYCTAKRLPTNFVGKANGYLASRDSFGQGFLLLRRDQLAQVTRTSDTLAMVFTEGDEVTTVSNLHIHSVREVTTTKFSRLDEIFLVEFRDKRALAEFTAINKGYNISNADWANPGNFYEATTDAGSEWFWANMFTNIWSFISPIAGAITTTAADWPVTPPSNFAFFGTSALKAAEHVCNHTSHHLLVKRDGTFHVVSKGDLDATNAGLLAEANDKALIPPESPLLVTVIPPEKVRVFFAKKNTAFQDNTDPLVVTGTDQFHVDPTYEVTVDSIAVVPTLTNTITNAIVPLYDSLGALYDEEGNALNAGILTTQAEKRATEYIQGLIRSEVQRDGLFHGPINFEVGPIFSHVHWYDFGDGVRTQVFNSSQKNGGGGGQNAITEWPDMPDLARWHLPFERFVVGEVYNEAIAANESGLVRVLFGTQTDADTTTWDETALPHEITAFEIYGESYAVDQRVFCGYHRQTSRWVIINTKGIGVKLAKFLPHESPDPVYDYPPNEDGSRCRKFPAYLFSDWTYDIDFEDEAYSCNEALTSAGANPQAIVVYNLRNWYIPEGMIFWVFEFNGRYYTDYVKPAGPLRASGATTTPTTSYSDLIFSDVEIGEGFHNVEYDDTTGEFTVIRACTVHVSVSFWVENGNSDCDPYYVEVGGDGVAAVSAATGYVSFTRDAANGLRSGTHFETTFNAAPGDVFSFRNRYTGFASASSDPTISLFDCSVLVETQNDSL